MKIAVKKLRDGAALPTRGSASAAGYDLRACIEESVVIAPGATAMVGTGLSIAVPCTINPGDRIAQLVVIPYLALEFDEVDELDATGRGAGGLRLDRAIKAAQNADMQAGGLTMKRLCALVLVCAALWLAGCGGASVRLTYSGAADEESTDYAALNRRGYNYQHGIGTAADIEKAVECYTAAAEHGIPEAMTNLGWCYERGEGVEQSYDRARELYAKAAALGEAMGMNNLGWLYENGFGVEQSYTTAYEWYARAAAAGCELAEENLAYLEAQGLTG